MNAAHKDLIRRNYTSLAKGLSPVIEDITRFLFEKQIISSRMKENIECKRTNTDKSYALLDLIPTRGAKAFDCLYSAALEEQLFAVADILNPHAAPHEGVIPQVTVQPVFIYKPTEDKLPDKWPSDVKDMESYKNVNLVQSNHIQMIELFKKSLTPAGQEYIYQMSGKPRGRVLIINNNKFNHMDDRDGTFKDRKALEILFQSLSFDVHCEKDKTAQEMKDLLKAEAANVDHSPYNCFILFILSHGHRGVVFGVDGYRKKEEKGSTYTLHNCIEIGTIVDLFCNAKSLQGKPKLFFIQACQGVAKDGGHQEGQSIEQQHSHMIVDEPTPPTSDATCSSTGATSPSSAPSGVTPAAPSTTHTAAVTSNGATSPSSAPSGVTPAAPSTTHTAVATSIGANSIIANTIPIEAASSIEHDRHTGASPGTEYNEPTMRSLNTTNSKRIVFPSPERAESATQEAYDEQINENLHIKNAVDDAVPSTTVGDAFGQKRPSGADVFVAMATIPGFLSWRNTVYGTWFIQAIVFVFANYAYKYDLGKLMTMVNNLVGRAETEKGYKQVGEKKDTFQKEFYFFPGLP